MKPFVPKHISFKISEAKKKEGIYCCAHGCRQKPNYKKLMMCHKHYARHRRIVDPVYDRYFNFKNNALRRCKDFTVTLDEFRDFCKETGYIITKGMRGMKCTVDRIRNYEGYHRNNLQLLSNRANIAKYNNEDKHFTELPNNHEDYTPF